MKSKLHIFFRRVSSANQSLATQIEFDRPFRNACNKNQTLIMDKDTTSANILRLDQRTKIMEVLELIEADKVDTVMLMTVLAYFVIIMKLKVSVMLV